MSRMFLDHLQHSLGTVTVFGWEVSAFHLLNAVVFGLIGIYSAWTVSRSLQVRGYYRDKQRKKQKRRQKQLEDLEERLKENGVLVTEERARITSLPTEKLLQDLKRGALKAVDVLHAFQAKAIQATRKCNCVTEFFTEAEEWAAALDSSSNKGPLFGLPVSIKENFDVAGYDTTCGLAKYVDCPRQKDAALVTGFKRVGAIPFCKTNVPQTLMSYGCENPVYGLTAHPTHPNRVPGGSSGGEACLIASGGSPIGIASDIAGSARIPTHFCGVTGIKPTGKRFSYEGGKSSLPSLPGLLVQCTPGLIGKDVDTIAQASRALLAPDILWDLDTSTVPLPWRDDIYLSEKKLRIGYCPSMPYFPATPGMQRAVEEAKTALQERGHELIPISLPNGKKIFTVSTDILMSDGGHYFFKEWKHESVSRAVLANKLTCSLPAWLRKLVSPFLGIISSRTATAFTSGTRVLESSKLWGSSEIRSNLIKEVVAQWQAERLDAIILPAFAFPSIPPQYPSLLYSAATYTLLFNLLDFPTGIVPVSHETQEDQAKMADYAANMEFDAVFTLVRKAMRDAEGLPLCVQVASFPWHEEVVLRVMRDIQHTIRK